MQYKPDEDEWKQKQNKANAAVGLAKRKSRFYVV